MAVEKSEGMGDWSEEDRKAHCLVKTDHELEA